MYNALRPVFRRHAHEDVIYYYFMLDVAMVCRLLCRKPYIYEESDLMQTYLPGTLLRGTLNYIDRRIIRHSLITAMTSEGFARYHYGTGYPDNIVFVPNRLNKKVLQLPYSPTPTDINHLRIAFVGGARFGSVVNFVQVFAGHFPQHEFHFYGTIIDHQSEFQKIRETYNNVYFHGQFSNPSDLPSIYENVDMVLATYDTKFDNVRYAEPNKLYEAAYFHRPIIVSAGTFLAEKVAQHGTGFAIDAMNAECVIGFINGLTPEKINRCIDNCKAMDVAMLINENPELFKKITDIRCV